MATVDPIRQIVATPVVTPRVSDGGARRQPQQEREAPRDSIEIEYPDEVDAAEMPVADLPEREGMLDISA